MTLIFFNNSKNKSKGILKEINKRLYGIFLFNVSNLSKNNKYDLIYLNTMAERLSEEEKIRIIQEVIETGNQAEVAKKYGRSTGIVSNLMNEFRRGTGVLPGIGIFSDELQDFARLKRQENFSYA
ncbi:MAG: transposase, partial [Thermoplasmata archaeon]